MSIALVLSAMNLSLMAAEPADGADLVPVGAAVVDVTPSYPIRLMGYGSRKTESEGVASPLKVRALAIGGDAAEKARRRARGAHHRRQLRGRGFHDRRGGQTSEGENRASPRPAGHLRDAYALRTGPGQWARLHLRRADTRPTRKSGSNDTPRN